MANTTAIPTILTDPGFLFWAPLGSTAPANTVVGSVFTDAWPVAWINLGATEDGSTFSYETSIEAVRVAELFDPVRYATTERSGKIAFNLASYTATNFKRAMNGGTLTVTGATTTTMTKYTPPTPGAEVRAMIGWESLDATVRIIAYQCINGNAIESSFKKAPDLATIPTEFNFEAPTSGVPFELWTAGVARG
jgi:hypothetical protein